MLYTVDVQLDASLCVHHTPRVWRDAQKGRKKGKEGRKEGK